MRIYRKHVRAFGKCRQGTKALCETYGISWDKLCSEGIDAQEILKTGDHRAAALVEQVRVWEARTDRSR
jgi:hypothetical protein